MKDGLDLDIVGWDIRKALFLYQKANPQLMEWLQSPIYKDTRGLREMLYNRLPQFYERERCYHHYYGMAQNNFRDYILKWRTAKIKKYLYVLRSVWACHYAIDMSKPLPIPIKFDVLRNHLPNVGKPNAEIDRILQIKLDRPAENVEIERSQELDDYIIQQLSELSAGRDRFDELNLNQKWKSEEAERIADLDEIFWGMVT